MASGGFRFVFLLMLLAFNLAATHVLATDIDRGVTVAAMGTGSAAACASCHGARGQGLAAVGAPALAGQPRFYLARQLRDFREGRRNNAVMGPVAQALDDATIESLAHYYSKLRAPAGALPRKGAAAEIVWQGNWSRELPPCVSCHGRAGEGIAPHFPRLAGQLRGYIEMQLKDWKAGNRANDPQGLMKSVADKLDDAQIAALATYFEAAVGDRP